MRERMRAAWAWVVAWAARLGLRRPSDAPYEATRRRLLLLNLGVVSAILIVMAVAVYAAESQALQQQVDQGLLNRSRLDNDIDAKAIVASMIGPGFNIPGSGADQSPDQQNENYEPYSPNIFTLVIARNGKLVLDPAGVSSVGLPDLGSARAAILTGNPGQPQAAVTVTYENQAYRLLNVPLAYDGQVVGVLQVGESLAFMQRQLSDLALRLLLVGVGMLALTAAASLYLADRALQPMREAYDRQRQFAAAASHELRTPLAFVRSQLELVTRRLQRAGGGETGGQATTEILATSEEDLRDTLNEVDYMTRLVRDLLLMARDQADHRSIAWEPVDVTELAREVAGTIQPAATAHDLTLEIKGADTPLWVDGDRDRLRQLLLILLENATHYTPAGGVIWIETRQTRDKLLARRRPLAQLIVGDTGVGIAPEHQERVFEAFYRAEGHNDGGNHSGSGLGLALARWIVNAHDGDLSLRSEPGEGSVFTIALPERTERVTDTDGDALEGDGIDSAAEDDGATAHEARSSAPA
ncbi:MAG TPA: HAMP domain-containing sensor histidine kinase [Ktedonobacterales bacterium]